MSTDFDANELVNKLSYQARQDAQKHGHNSWPQTVKLGLKFHEGFTRRLLAATAMLLLPSLSTRKLQSEECMLIALGICTSDYTSRLFKPFHAWSDDLMIVLVLKTACSDISFSVCLLATGALLFGVNL